jgi:hypothetical protein
LSFQQVPSGRHTCEYRKDGIAERRTANGIESLVRYEPIVVGLVGSKRIESLQSKGPITLPPPILSKYDTRIEGGIKF